jgi:putrescine transport system permease protein
VVSVNTLLVAKERKRLRDMQAALAVAEAADAAPAAPQPATARKSLDTASA